MTSTSTVNIQICINKLKAETKFANGRGFVTIKVALVEMAIKALEQQQSQIAATQGEHIGLAVSKPVDK